MDTSQLIDYLDGNRLYGTPPSPIIPIFRFKKVKSTNATAIRLSPNFPTWGVVASCQINGQGQRGKTWYSGSTGGIYYTMVSRLSRSQGPKGDAWSEFPFTLGRLTAEFITQFTGLSVHVEWPNDLILEFKKVGGILVTTHTRGTEVSAVVVGVGINVNQVTFPESLRYTAISCRQVLGKRIDMESMLSGLIKVVHDAVARYSGSDSR